MARRVRFRLLPFALLIQAASLATPVLAQGAAAPAVGGVAAAPAAASASALGVSAGVAPATANDVVHLQAELQQQRELVMLMRHRLADADSARAWLPWLGLGLVLSTSLAGWLALGAWRARRGPRGQQASRPALDSRSDAAGTAAPTGGRAGAVEAMLQARVRGDTVVAGAADTRQARDDGARGAALADGRAPVQSPPTTTAASMGVYESDPTTLTRPAVAAPRQAEPAVLPSELSLAGQAPRAVTVEELLDLEQQVDFFMVLGQEDAAIDLLVSHIRITGGTSALPYLKLLEVYRQQGDADGYERTRSRFNQRFNAYAPDWSADPEAGRALDGYPEVLDRIQTAWPLPYDAMAELERLMFRRQQGEVFELPAYRELLLLYAVARDLGELDPHDFMPVDLLLPLEDESQETTSPRPHLGMFSEDSLGGRTADWARMNEQPVARDGAGPGDRTVSLRSAELPPPRIDLDMALDIDLTEFAPAPREFTQPAAFNDVDSSRSDFSSFDAAPVPPRRSGH